MCGQWPPRGIAFHDYPGHFNRHLFRVCVTAAYPNPAKFDHVKATVTLVSNKVRVSTDLAAGYPKTPVGFDPRLCLQLCRGAPEDRARQRAGRPRAISDRTQQQSRCSNGWFWVKFKPLRTGESGWPRTCLAYFPSSASRQIAHRSRARNGAFSFAGGAGTWIGGPWSLLAVRVELRRTASTSAFSIALSRSISAVAISDLRKGG